MNACQYVFGFLACMIAWAIVNEIHYQGRIRARNKRLGERLNDLEEGRK